MQKNVQNWHIAQQKTGCLYSQLHEYNRVEATGSQQSYSAENKIEFWSVERVGDKLLSVSAWKGC